LNKVDFPTLGRPTIPTEKPIEICYNKKAIRSIKILKMS